MISHYRIHIYFFFSLFIIGILSVTSFASNQQLRRIIHFPVKTGFVRQPVVLEAKFEDLNIQVQYVRLFYRVKGSEDYQYVDMDEQTDNFVGEIPAFEVKAPAMEYFLSALLSDNSVVSSPASNPFYGPYEVTITESPNISSKLDIPSKQEISSISATAVSTLILSPEPNTSVKRNEAIIAVSFLTESGEVDINSVQLFLDGENITRQTEITANMLSYVPDDISPGKHDVKFQFKDNAGNSYQPTEWSFRILTEGKLRETKKPNIRGNIFFDTKNEKVSDNTLISNNTGANVSGKYGIIQYRGSVFITSREKKDQQPRNRYLMDVNTRWIGLRWGDTNPRFHELILWGKRVRGIEAYLKLGFFNVEFVHGETNRAVNGKLYNFQIGVNNDTTWTNPVTNDTVYSTDGIYKTGTYRQTLRGIHTSFGSKRNFQFGLTLLKVKDDVKSIKYGRNPQDNVVFGPDLLIAFDNHRIEFKSGAAFSLLTTDISIGPFSTAELDSEFVEDIPFDPADFKDFLIINTTTTPLNPLNLTSLAYYTQFKFNYFRNSFLIQYKSIGSDYNSLGNTFLRKDIQGFEISDRIRLWQNQVYLTIGYEQYIDGLDKEHDDNPDTKPTELKTFDIGISYYPRGLGLPRVSLAYKNHNRSNGLDAQAPTNAINNLTQDISVQIGYDVQLFNLDHSINLSIIGSDRIDDFNPASLNVASDIRMLTIRTNYQIPLTTTVTYAFNQSSTGQNVNASSFKYSQIGLSADYRFLNDKLRLSGGLNITSAVGKRPDNNIIDEYTNYKRQAFNVGANYQITPKQYLLFDTSYINFDDKYASSYKDSIIRLRYELKF